MDKPLYRIFTLFMLFVPVIAGAENTFSSHHAGIFSPNWQAGSQDMVLSYQESSEFSSPSLSGNSISTEYLTFETVPTPQGQIYFDYPDNSDHQTDAYLSERASPNNWQNMRLYKLIPKDWIPYLGLQVKYNITDKLGVVNAITPNNIFYGLTYTY